ncbi:hypothetical protein D584_07638 [Brucella intermedia M86]|uniref:Uncharacterized protein n=1 Tax=Brucella intermedia M86 TaxID=1234597 RepID=M5JQ78_9HYPH|nr:hypothetical protein D584_07638 [Brucella intermedia M86]
MTATRRSIMSGTIALAAAGTTLGSAPAQASNPLKTRSGDNRVVTKDGVAIFYKDWAPRMRNPSCFTMAGR